MWTAEQVQDDVLARLKLSSPPPIPWKTISIPLPRRNHPRRQLIRNLRKHLLEVNEPLPNSRIEIQPVTSPQRRDPAFHLHLNLLQGQDQFERRLLIHCWTARIQLHLQTFTLWVLESEAITIPHHLIPHQRQLSQRNDGLSVEVRDQSPSSLHLPERHFARCKFNLCWYCGLELLL